MGSKIVACTHIPIVAGQTRGGTLGAYDGPYQNCFLSCNLNSEDTGNASVSVIFDGNATGQYLEIKPGNPTLLDVPSGTIGIELAIQEIQGSVTGVFLSANQNF